MAAVAAAAVEAVRTDTGWSAYVTSLVANVRHEAERIGYLGNLRFLLYPSRLTEKDRARIAMDQRGLVWL